MQVALGIVGAVIGGYIGGPAGASLGFALGSAIGAAAFPPEGPHLEGPRLSDLHGTISTYGAGLTRIYGEVGIPGNIIWMDPIRETSSETEMGGKGGPTSTSTNYSYSASFALALCDLQYGESISALNRIWINGKCYYDVRDEADVLAIVSSKDFAEFFTFYDGNYSQEPDPTIEASLGVGNVPAYRGTCYIVFNDLPLEWFHNSPPGALQIVCELIKNGTPSSGLRKLAEAYPVVGAVVYPVVDNIIRTGNHEPGDYQISVFDTSGTFIGNGIPDDQANAWPRLYGDSSISDSTKAVVLLYDDTPMRAAHPNPSVLIGSTLIYAQAVGGDLSLTDLIDPTHYFSACIPCADLRHVLIYTNDGIGGTGDDFYWLIKWNGRVTGWTLVSTGDVDALARPSLGSGNASQGVLFYSGILESDLRHVWWNLGNSFPQVRLDEIDPSSGDLVKVDTYQETPSDADFTYTSIWADDGIAYCTGGSYYKCLTRNTYAATNSDDLADIVGAELLLAGLDISQIDVSALVGIAVDGVAVTRVSATRGVIANLQRAYWFDLIESAGQLKAVLKGGSSVVTIPQDDLSAGDGESSSGNPVDSERADEDSLPASISVAYIDKSIDYQVGAQEDQRAAVLSEQPTGIDLGLVLSAQKAKEVASVLLYDAWQTRSRRTFRTSREYSYLEPSDVVTLDLDDFSLTVALQKVKTSGGVLEFEAVDADAALYDPHTEAGSVGTPTELIPLLPTYSALMDLPPLLAADDDPGFYWAASGYSTGWTGAQLLVSSDGGVTYTVAAVTDLVATMGTVSTAVGDWEGGNFTDSINTITVQLGPQASALTSVTLSDLLSSGVNFCALGSEENGFELIQFKTATLSGTRLYVLAGLLRGRLGTEDKIATHTANEKFVLLTPSTIKRVAGDISGLNVSRSYKAVTFGQRVSSALTYSFTNTGRSLQPYSPVNAEATGFGDDIVITWYRRGRLYNFWLDSIDVPLSEDTESYEVDVYDGATVVRTLTSSTPTVTYTSAQQGADFGSPIPSSIDVRIYQLSALVGRGLPFIGTLS